MHRPAHPKISRRKFLSILAGSAGLGLGLPWLLPSQKMSSRAHKNLPKLYQRGQRLLGTWVSITLFSHEESQATEALHEAFSAIRTIDDLMSIHRPHSQLSQLNRLAGTTPISVDHKIIQILQHAHHYSEKTRGAYDVSILPLMKLFGFYGTPPTQIPKDKLIAKTLERVGYEHIWIDPLQHTVGLEKRGAGIDLGSIGKGFAIDEALQVLRHKDIRSALIDAGGNLYALGSPYEDPDPRSGWRIGIQDPHRLGTPMSREILLLKDQAVATSAGYYNSIRVGSTEITHILHGQTGKPCTNHVCCSVVAPTATQADALSTTGYILGPDTSRTLFETPQIHFYFYS